MTELQSATSSQSGSEGDDSLSTSVDTGGNLVEGSPTETSVDLNINSLGQLQITDSDIDGENRPIDSDNEDEPLGYKHFLCDVNIEYNLGGSRSSSGSHEHCFKMKRLPYMVEHERLGPSRCSSKSEQKISDGSSSDIDISCDQINNITLVNGHNQAGRNMNSDGSDKSSLDLSTLDHYFIDVTKATCAFLGNSDYVPQIDTKQRQVVIELVSARLSQNVSPFPSSHTSNMTNLINQAENSSLHNTDTRSISSSEDSIDGPQIKRGLVATQTVTSSTRKFVNYTILIRTVPGLDHKPAVIERRFSDFLALYQILKSNKQHARIVDEHISFPKKVYMGNFTVAKIAERSIQFTRLLNLCMQRSNLMWSVPFASFLIDKELKEAHKLSLCGDPDDVQVLVETVYHILKKLYLTTLTKNCIGPLNQRLLVTYCMLFIVHCRNQNYHELKQAVQEFTQLISTQDFVDSLIISRHYNSLRASLLFLMNLNQANVVDDGTRLWLKRKLEDIDGAYAELHNEAKTYSGNDNGGRSRITKKELTSLIRERNFCLFQDNIK